MNETKQSADTPKILMLTGKQGSHILQKYIPKNAGIKVLPVDVAAFINKEMILKNLDKKEVQHYDLVMLPGLIQDDLTSLIDYYKVPFVKGPRYASDIIHTIQFTDPFKLSPLVAADKLLKNQFK